MIASVHYHVTGNEPIGVLGRKLVFYPASGYVIIDIIIKGLSKNFDDLVINEETGEVWTNEALSVGDACVCVYKTIPRFVIPQTPQFEGADMETDFLV